MPDDPTKFIFMQLIFDGTVNLFLRQTVGYNEEVLPQGYADGKPARFSRNRDLYYLSFPDYRYEEITSVKSLLNILNDESGKLAKFIKENKLKTNNSEDLFKIMEFYEKPTAN
jgi:hypothetical protein